MPKWNPFPDIPLINKLYIPWWQAGMAVAAMKTARSRRIVRFMDVEDIERCDFLKENGAMPRSGM